MLPTNQSPQQNTNLSKLRRVRSAGEPIRLKIISPSDAEQNLFVQLQWSDHWIKHELIKALGQMPEIVVTDHQPNAVLHLFGFPTPLDPRFYTMGWIYGHPELITDFELAQYDHLFCYSTQFLEELQRRGFEAELMLGATGKKPRQDVNLRYPATFVGNARPGGGGRLAVEALLETGEPFLVWGHGWQGRLPQKNFGGEYFDYGKLEELYAASEFSLNDHHPDMRRWGFVSFRLYDILASGGFAVSDRNDGIAEIFGDSIPQYSDGNELRQIIAHYHAHPEQRERLIKQGMEAALSHTWEARAEQIRQHLLTVTQPERQVVEVASPQSTDPEPAAKGRLKVFYIDLFPPESFNLCWLKAFKKSADVDSFDLKEDVQKLENRILTFNPDHIHLGSSVKNGLVSSDLLREIKDWLKCSVSVFCADAPFSGYHMELSRVVDHIYITNKTHMKLNAEKDLTNFSYLPCPTDPDVFKFHNAEKLYDLLFIGNNNNNSRLELLKRIHQRYNLVVAGGKWEDTGLKALPAVCGEEFSALCGKAKILLGLIGDEWKQLEAYFSYRLVNVLASASFLIQSYTPGLETMFTNRRHLVWFKTEEELFELIEYYLHDDEERRRIAFQGQTEVLNKYTYDRHVTKILEDAKEKRNASGIKRFQATVRTPDATPGNIRRQHNVVGEPKSPIGSGGAPHKVDYLFQPIFIVGFHHSGTRLLAKLLHQFGVFQVVDRPTYEWGYIQNLNTTILPNWNNPEAVRRFDAVLGSHHISVQDILYLLQRNGYHGGQPWAHKDPRTCATLAAWLKVFPAASVVHIIRDPLDVLGTISAEYSIFTPEEKLPQQALPFWADLWMAYLDQVLEVAPGAEKFIEVKFEDLYVRPKAELLRITDELDLHDGNPVDTEGIQPGKIGIYKQWIENGKLDYNAVERLKISVGDYRKRYRYEYDIKQRSRRTNKLEPATECAV